nr:bifunctional glycosyltransferase family 2/GtrA family protein [Demequina soli]
MTPARPATTDVEIVVPVYNEEAALEASVRRLHAYLRDTFPFTSRVVIADNASTDGTLAIAERLSRELAGVRVLHLDAKGRGHALAEAWGASDAAVVAYMDVDLSTDLRALPPLIAPLLSGHSDVAIGTRLARGSRVVRGPKRELISRTYNLMLHTFLRARFSDAQCGFKAIRADRARQLLPYVEDGGWFFDTELLVLAERAGLRIHEVPVDWTDDPDSRVDIAATAWGDIRGMARVGRALATGRIPLSSLREPDAIDVPAPPRLIGQVVRFAIVGVASTLAYLLLYLLLRHVMEAQAANAVALIVTTVANTAANRAFTFRTAGGGQLRHQLQGLLVFGLGLILTSGGLRLLHVIDPDGTRLEEVIVLVAANVAATLLRFLLFRHWVFRGPADEGTTR